MDPNFQPSHIPQGEEWLQLVLAQAGRTHQKERDSHQSTGGSYFYTPLFYHMNHFYMFLSTSKNSQKPSRRHDLCYTVNEEIDKRLCLKKNPPTEGAKIPSTRCQK